MRKFLFLFCGFIFIVSYGYPQNVFINEIHYDNSGSDKNEAIEIAAPTSTDLTDWDIILYNGGNGKAYKIVALSGTVPDQDNGYGTLSFSISGIQNGPDGIALIDASDNVVQFLSYEGTFTAADGLAMGHKSDDIGVSETSSTELGHSLQLTGTGTRYSDFTWQANLPATFGAVNEGQYFGAAPELTVVINEFVFNHYGSPDTNEFIELKSIANADLSAYTLLLIEGDSAAAAGAGTIKKIYGANSSDANGYWTTGMLAEQFDNGSLSLLLVKGFTGKKGDDIDVNDDGVIDTVFWDEIKDDVAVVESASSKYAYANVVLTADFDDGTSMVGGASRIPDGTDTDTITDWVRNDFYGEGLTAFSDAVAEEGRAVNTPGTVNKVKKSTTVASVFINEIHYDNSGSDKNEAIEIAAPAATDLTDWYIILYNGGNGKAYKTVALSGTVPDQDNGYGTLSFSISGIQNGPDGIALIDASDNVVQFLSYEGTFTAVDGLATGHKSDDIGVSETSSTELGHSLQLTGTGTRYSDFTWQANLPATFGAVNTKQAFGTGSSPEEKVLTIAQARDSADNTVLSISGVLTVAGQFGTLAYLQDSTAGIAIYDEKVYGKGKFRIGDSITITGTKTTYNGQAELVSLTTVSAHGEAVSPVRPLTITLDEMALHPAELVKIEHVTFSAPGTMMFGNTNIEIADISGSGEIRIDKDVADLVGLAQPASCSEAIGVVSRYNTISRLMPRIKNDLSCAGKYVADDGLGISRDSTFDIVTWNIEWFGDESNSPAGNKADSVQKDSVKAILKALDADIYAVEEIADEALMAKMVSEMNGYDYVLSDAVSYPKGTGIKQKTGFIYKTATVSAVKTTPLLASVHPYYNGGDASALSNYPGNDASRFWASGRLPFLMVANVTIGRITKTFHMVAIHARANSSSTATLKYNMRKYDIEVLKDSLDQYYANVNLILLGDYNDDVDETVADVSSSVTSYESFVNDTANYSTVTDILSEKNCRSYVTRENMIDHITLSNELFNQYIDSSARVHYEFYDSDYTKTASDHFPVSVRIKLFGNGTDTPLPPVDTLSGMTMYPNPASGGVNVNISSDKSRDVQLFVFNVSGRKVMQKEYESVQSIQFDMSGYNPGLYLVYLNIDGEELAVRKLIIKK